MEEDDLSMPYLIERCGALMHGLCSNCVADCDVESGAMNLSYGFKDSFFYYRAANGQINSIRKRCSNIRDGESIISKRIDIDRRHAQLSFIWKAMKPTSKIIQALLFVQVYSESAFYIIMLLRSKMLLLVLKHSNIHMLDQLFESVERQNYLQRCSCLSIPDIGVLLVL